jgi:hypothetical protein
VQLAVPTERPDALTPTLSHRERVKTMLHPSPAGEGNTRKKR